MKLVVIESPYAGDIEKNVAYACRAMSDCIKRGEAPIASHLLYTQEGILDDNIPEERAAGIQCGLEWAKKADYAVFYIDNGMSNGMKAAQKFYEMHNIKYLYRTLEKTA